MKGETVSTPLDKDGTQILLKAHLSNIFFVNVFLVLFISINFLLDKFGSRRILIICSLL